MITEERNRTGGAVRSLSGDPNKLQPSTPSPAEPAIRVGKVIVPAEVNGRLGTAPLFTLTLGDETIQLLPLKTWSQLDLFKWRVQGKLPGTPASLEVAGDHVKLAGETVWTTDPEGCAKLERVFNEWLASERASLELAKQKAQTPSAPVSSKVSAQEPLRFQVQTDKTGQPHIVCLEGGDTAANVAVTVPGLNSLITQGLMRKPGAWRIGALRDWIELDGEVIRLRNGEHCALERTLNDRYLPDPESDLAQDVRVLPNPASSSGFDIQFIAADLGLPENRQRHLDAQAMELLSDPQRCRILRKGILVKLTPPFLIFKQKTTDGGERELSPGPENTVSSVAEDGQQKTIDLSQPVNHLGLGAAELTAIFNHPAVNRRAKRAAARAERGARPAKRRQSCEGEDGQGPVERFNW